MFWFSCFKSNKKRGSEDSKFRSRQDILGNDQNVTYTDERTKARRSKGRKPPRDQDIQANTGQRSSHHDELRGPGVKRPHTPEGLVADHRENQDDRGTKHLRSNHLEDQARDKRHSHHDEQNQDTGLSKGQRQNLNEDPSPPKPGSMKDPETRASWYEGPSTFNEPVTVSPKAQTPSSHWDQRESRPEDPRARVSALQSLGYGFNSKGHLVQLDNYNQLTDIPFKFESQSHYEELGEAVTEEVYRLLETKAQLRRISLNGGSFVFASRDLETNDQRLMVIIHGSGVVRAGQWSRKLIINNGLEFGSQLPYIEKAKALGFSVVVFNTNDYKGYSSPSGHAFEAWEQVVRNSPARQITIVAHSYGGVVTVDLAKNFMKEFKSRVFSVMFTDSVHRLRNDNSEVSRLLAGIARNYVQCYQPTGVELDGHGDAVPCVSAGHGEHEWTSWAAFDHIFTTLTEKINFLGN